jgi:hypothetical protein
LRFQHSREGVEQLLKGRRERDAAKPAQVAASLGSNAPIRAAVMVVEGVLHQEPNHESTKRAA